MKRMSSRNEAAKICFRMIKLNKLADFVYKTAIRRGKIRDSSSPMLAIAQISAEWRELWEATNARSEHLPIYSEKEEEAADVIIATISFLKHIGCDDIEALLRAKIDYNSQRQ